MIIFWVLVVAMLVVALFFTIRPLQKDLSQDDIDRSSQNVAITKERLNDLKLEFEEETISQAEYEQTREELEQALLNDVESSYSENKKQVNDVFYSRVTRFVMLFSVPTIAVGLYFYLGYPDLLDGHEKHTAAPAGHAATNGANKLGSVEEMIGKLATRLKENPDNAEGWFMLARSYMSLKRYEEAVVALEKTNQLIPNNPVVMLRYADALTMLNGGRISDQPFELIKKAVELKPDDPTGLWLIGMGYEERGDFQKAISYWNLLLGVLSDEQSKNEVNILISQAKRKAGITTIEQTNKSSLVTKPKLEANIISSIKVDISLDKDLLKNVSANDIVFIFARALEGPPMPLAVVRKLVKDLPLNIELDDSMAMVPTMKLSNFKEVQVIARISKSGSAKAQSGDLQSNISIVNTAQNKGVVLNIDKVLP